MAEVVAHKCHILINTQVISGSEIIRRINVASSIVLSMVIFLKYVFKVVEAGCFQLLELVYIGVSTLVFTVL